MMKIYADPPQRCRDCPCSYWIQYGEFRGLLMCQLMEYMDPKTDKKYFLVDEEDIIRPARCPLKEV